MIGAACRAAIAGRTSWWAPALVAAMCSALAGPCLLQTISASDPRMSQAAAQLGTDSEDLVGAGLTLATVLIVSSMIVMAVVAAATVGRQTQDLARWRLAGAGPATMGSFVLSQLLLVSATGGLLGAAATVLVGPPLAQLLNSMAAPGMQDVPVPVLPGVLAITVLLPVGVSLLAGIWPALRATSAPAIAAVAPIEDAGGRVGPWRWIVTAAGCLALSLEIGSAASHPAGDLSDAASVALGLGCSIIVVFGVGARVLVHALLRGWTRLVPLRSSVWEIARAGAISRARTSGATVVALATGIACLCVLSGIAYTMQDVLTALAGRPQVLNFRDLRIISAAVGALCATGGVCVLALAASDRRREVALLRSNGMTASGITVLVLAEASVLALTAALVGALATTLATAEMTWAADRAGMPVRFHLPLPELGLCAAICVALLTVIMLVPALRALRSSIRESLAAH